MLVRRNAPGLDIIVIEADPRLAKLIEANFLNNKLLSHVVINAIAGDHSQADARFSLNPASTLDNRVNIAHWRSEENTSEIKSLMRILYDVYCLKQKT